MRIEKWIMHSFGMPTNERRIFRVFFFVGPDGVTNSLGFYLLLLGAAENDSFVLDPYTHVYSFTVNIFEMSFFLISFLLWFVSTRKARQPNVIKFEALKNDKKCLSIHFCSLQKYQQQKQIRNFECVPWEICQLNNNRPTSYFRHNMHAYVSDDSEIRQSNRTEHVCSHVCVMTTKTVQKIIFSLRSEFVSSFHIELVVARDFHREDEKQKKKSTFNLDNGIFVATNWSFPFRLFCAAVVVLGGPLRWRRYHQFYPFYSWPL